MAANRTEHGLIPTLSRMVAMPTVSGRPMDELAGYLAERMEARGVRVERYEVAPGRCNVVGRVGPRNGRGVVLSGHLDVVPTEGQNWSTDPYKLVEVDGALQGRGSCDMKGFVAAATCALDDIDLGALREELVLMWTCEEEVGCAGSRALVDRYRAELGDLPSATIVGEPTGLQVCRMHPGHTTLRVTLRGRSAHSSRPELGLNAIQLARGVLSALENLEDELRLATQDIPQLERPWVVLNVGRIQGGAAINIVPEHCTVDLGLRPLPGQSAALMVALVRDALEGCRKAAEARGGAIDVELLLDAPPLLTAAGTTLEAALLPLARSPVVGGVPFATDAGNLERLGLSCLIFGPGSIDLAHRPDERVPIDQLVATQHALAKLIGVRAHS